MEKTDREILQESYDKYSDKFSKKAQALKLRIDSMISMEKIFNDCFNPPQPETN